MKFSDKQKLVMTVLVFLVIGGTIGFLNYTKVRERISQSEEIDRLANEEKLASDKIQRIPGLRDQRSKLINIIDQYAEILPREDHVQHENFVKIIDGYRQDTKVIIQKAEYIKPKDKDKTKEQSATGQENFVRHRYKFKLLGTVPDFIDFVNKIENHTRFLKVDAISIRPVGAPSDDANDELSERIDEDELARASEPVKEIELTVSTYTYSKGQEQKT